MDVREQAANEKRLIDVNDIYSLFNQSGFARLHVADIDTIPRVDAVEVVRCFECEKHCESNGKHYCKFWRMYCPDDSEFFCKAGERKEGADNG